MNTYLCWYKGTKLEVYAETTYDAQQLAVSHFQSRSRRQIKGHEITVKLQSLDGVEVSHSTGSL